MQASLASRHSTGQQGSAARLTASSAVISASRGEAGRLPSASGLGSAAFFSLITPASSLQGERAGRGEGARQGHVSQGVRQATALGAAFQKFASHQGKLQGN